MFKGWRKCETFKTWQKIPHFDSVLLWVAVLLSTLRWWLCCLLHLMIRMMLQQTSPAGSDRVQAVYYRFHHSGNKEWKKSQQPSKHFLVDGFFMSQRGRFAGSFVSSINWRLGVQMGSLFFSFFSWLQWLEKRMSSPSDSVCFDRQLLLLNLTVFFASAVVCAVCWFCLLVLSSGSTLDHHTNPLGVCCFAVLVL